MYMYIYFLWSVLHPNDFLRNAASMSWLFVGLLVLILGFMLYLVTYFYKGK